MSNNFGKRDQKRIRANFENFIGRHAYRLDEFVAQMIDNASGDIVIAGTEVDGFAYTVIKTPVRRHPDAGLSEREKQVAFLVGRGLGNKRIATLLEISPHTVSAHLRSIFKKLRVRSRSAVGLHFLASSLVQGPLVLES